MLWFQFSAELESIREQTKEKQQLPVCTGEKAKDEVSTGLSAVNGRR